MSTTDNGGPAFPTPAEFFSDGSMRRPAGDGMTLRDYFAAKAMPIAIKYWTQEGAAGEDGGIFVWEMHEASGDCFCAAVLAYRMADAMLQARSE